MNDQDFKKLTELATAVTQWTPLLPLEEFQLRMAEVQDFIEEWVNKEDEVPDWYDDAVLELRRPDAKEYAAIVAEFGDLTEDDEEYWERFDDLDRPRRIEARGVAYEKALESLYAGKKVEAESDEQKDRIMEVIDRALDAAVENRLDEHRLSDPFEGPLPPTDEQ